MLAETYIAAGREMKSRPMTLLTLIVQCASSEGVHHVMIDVSMHVAWQSAPGKLGVPRARVSITTTDKQTKKKITFILRHTSWQIILFTAEQLCVVV